jgi:enoyl-CoA hydratase/carnithine racemase
VTDAAPLLVERDGAVVTLRLDRPHVLNALSPTLVEALLDAVEAVGRDAEARCLVITANGRAFSAGADLGAMLAMDRSAFADFIGRLQELSRRMRALSIPTIAAVHGHALAGGFELALECDIRVAATDAVFGLPDTAIGLSPTSGMSYLLPLVVGDGWARDLLLTGRWIDAAQAERIGLVTQVMKPDELESTVRALAADLAGHPPVGIGHIKAELRRGADADFEAALGDEARREIACFETDAVRARLRAFVERPKRPGDGRSDRGRANDE